jgi:predicted O-methyltransferase YrrM
MKDTRMTPAEINSIIGIPDWDQVSAIKGEEAAFIYDFVLRHKLNKTLEVGFAFAKSASHIIAATQSTHIACDPFQKDFRDVGLKNIEKLGYSHFLDFRPQFSYELLPELLKEKRSFEFIFIDGDHKFDGIMLDFYYADLLLEENGYVLFHDSWMRSTKLVDTFIRKNRKDYEPVPTPIKNFCMFRKIGKDTRNGMHFREFYTFRSLLSYNLIMWISTGKKTGLKKFLVNLKKRLTSGETKPIR